MSGARNTRSSFVVPSQDSAPKKRRKNPYGFSQPLPGTSRSADDHDYVGGSFSQSSNRLSVDLVSSQEERQLVSTIIKYILIIDKTHKMINKAGIIRNALAGNGRDYLTLMLKVKSVFRKTFGYKLVEFETNKYIVVNTIQNTLPHISLNATEKAQKVLLFLILTHIFMCDETSPEELLWEFLRTMGVITRENFVHDYFGDIRQSITVDFVNQKYLNKVLVKEGDPPRYEYRWGIRAEYEISRRNALEFVSKVCGRPLEQWTLQYKSVQAREGADEPVPS